jgi:hypothetical protein
MSEPVALNSPEAFLDTSHRSQGGFENVKLSSMPKNPFEIPEELRGESIAPGVLETLDVTRDSGSFPLLWFSLFLP